jgi:hypothetical protein
MMTHLLTIDAQPKNSHYLMQGGFLMDMFLKAGVEHAGIDLRRQEKTVVHA